MFLFQTHPHPRDLPLRAPSFPTRPPSALPQPGASWVTEIRGAGRPRSGRAATGFARLAHAFATNAAKYGALSTEEGRIAIDCSEQDGVFVLLWQKRGG